jgi:DNA-binding response OmpR family regulator
MTAHLPIHRILIVDDNVDAASTVAELLTLYGHATIVAHGGVEALRALGEFHPDTVILDIGMPDINGYEVAREIRRCAGGAGIKLIALTAWGDASARLSSTASGFDRHLSKPAGVESLLWALEDC